ncbi:hypothetical protein B0H19DRAFT_1318683 [Mycena capillaripes]|nr:hypothetical protein B0H19DRAFT_1318683 [Mycena capillaripes]
MCRCLRSSPSMPELPGELVDSLIDLVKSDKMALTACSLVSKQWLPRARHHKFSSISLVWGMRENVLEFLSVAGSLLATIIPFIHEVRLTYKRNTLAGSHGLLIISPRKILADLNDRGIRPISLYLDCLLYFLNAIDHPTTFASSLVHLQLNVERNYLAVDNIIDYICAFPLLESLKIYGTPYIHYWKTSIKFPPTLHTLHASQGQITDSILALDLMPKQITTFGFIATRDWDRSSNLHKYFLSPSAEVLTRISFQDCDFSSDSDGLDFNKLPCLQHLEVATKRKATQHVAAEALLHLLGKLRLSSACRTLETVTISCTYDRYLSLQWTAIDEVLADTSSWPRLRHIQLTAAEGLSDCDLGIAAHNAKRKFSIAAVLRSDLRQCEARGQLRIDIPSVPPRRP